MECHEEFVPYLDTRDDVGIGIRASLENLY